MKKEPEFVAPASVPWPRVQVNRVTQPEVTPSQQPALIEEPMNARGSQVAAAVFFVFSLFLLLICGWLLWRVWGLAREVRSLRALDSQRQVIAEDPNQSSVGEEQVGLIESVSSPSAEVAKPTPTTDPVTRLPTDWEKFAFPDLKLTMYAPPGYKSDLQLFDNGEYLVRFWQGAEAGSATIQLAIKQNWNNTGDSQQAARTIKMNQGIMAGKIDPPAKSAVQLDRYQTNYFFAYNNKVYYLTCVHNWLTKEYQQCKTMVETMEVGL